MHEPIKLPSIETRRSWIVATVVLVILALSFGAPWITVVALKLIAAETGGLRSVPALAASLAWIGYGAGGILMGQIAERTGVRFTVIFGAVMICIGLALSTGGGAWQLFFVHGPVHGVPRHRRHECAVLHLCEPLVRSPPRFGAGADLERRVSRRRGLAPRLRTGHRLGRLAADHALLRCARACRHRPAGGDLSEP